MKRSWCALLGAVAISSLGCAEDPQIAFAECLVDKKAELYTAAGCSYCEKQKDLFEEEAWEILQPNVIDCGSLKDIFVGKQAQKCIDQRIIGFPTWVFGDGKKAMGYLDFEQLEKYSGCKYEP
ncbi:MAG: hypothetical protein AABW48_01910 [Nanoarchaeota archaeon]